MHMIARGLRENRVFLVTSILILFILLIAFLAPHIAPYDPLSASMKDANLAPSSSHIFGTDKLGRDVFSRILCGAERSLSSVLFLVALIFVVGTTAGVISGYAGGIVDIGPLGEEEYRTRQPPRLAMNIGVRSGRRDLRGNSTENEIGIGTRQPRVERQLEHHIGAMRDAMPPSLAGNEAAIIADAAQIGRPGFGEGVEFGLGQKSLDAVSARDLG